MKIPKSLKFEKCADRKNPALRNPYYDHERRKVIVSDGRKMIVVDVDPGDACVSGTPVKSGSNSASATYEIKPFNPSEPPFPTNWKQVLDRAVLDSESGEPHQISLDAKKLHELAQGLGSNTVTLKYSIKRGECEQMNMVRVFPTKGDGVGIAEGVIMPVRSA